MSQQLKDNRFVIDVLGMAATIFLCSLFIILLTVFVLKKMFLAIQSLVQEVVQRWMRSRSGPSAIAACLIAISPKKA